MHLKGCTKSQQQGGTLCQGLYTDSDVMLTDIAHKKLMHTILFKIITRMKLLFSSYLGDYSYSFQGSVELISITVTVSLFFCKMQLQKTIPLRNFQEFAAVTFT